MYSDLNQSRLFFIQFEPGNTSTEITLPDSTMELYNLGYSPESITDALYKAALKTERCGYKKQQLKQAQAAASAEAAAKRAAEKKAEDAKRSAAEKRAQAAAAKQQKQKAKETRSTQPENRPQRTHDDLMKDMERLKKCSWYRFKHYRSNSTLQ
jgi:hypothetical protein